MNILLTEVAPRDGMQNELHPVTTEPRNLN